MARQLTRAEAVVIGTELASVPVLGRERIVRSGLPTRTFETARQRVVAAGWVVDRYVPDPMAFGRPRAVFALGRPFAEHAREAMERWRDHDGCVVLYQSPDSLFGVFFLPDGGGTRMGLSGTLGSDQFSRVLSVEADLRRPSVPVYFDFEGAFSRLLGLSGTASYPQSLPDASGAGRSGPLHGRELATVAELLRLPFLPLDEAAPARRLSARLSGSWAMRRRLGDVVVRRMFVDPAALPGYLDWRLRSIVFVHGRLRAGVAPQAPYLSLVTRCAVTPFLYATDEKAVLLAGLSPAPVRASTGGSVGRPSVTSTLEESLEKIEVFREPVDGLVCAANHRYDRLVGALASDNA